MALHSFNCQQCHKIRESFQPAAKFCSQRCNQLFWERHNRERLLAMRRRSYDKHKESRRETARKYNTKNRTKRAEWQKHYRENNIGIINSHVALRKAKRLQRTPSWANLKAIQAFYLQCPKNMTVDHIIPLNGKTVSGLHVLENLQYLTRSENSRKNNRFLEEHL